MSGRVEVEAKIPQKSTIGITRFKSPMETFKEKLFDIQNKEDNLPYCYLNTSSRIISPNWVPESVTDSHYCNSLIVKQYASTIFEKRNSKFQRKQSSLLSFEHHQMNAADKRAVIKGVVKTVKAEFFFLQETKMEVIDAKVIRSISVFPYASYVFAPSIAASRGVLLWNPMLWQKLDDFVGSFSVCFGKRSKERCGEGGYLCLWSLLFVRPNCFLG